MKELQLIEVSKAAKIKDEILGLFDNEIQFSEQTNKKVNMNVILAQILCKFEMIK